MSESGLFWVGGVLFRVGGGEGVWGIILGGCENILGGWRWVVMSGGGW